MGRRASTAAPTRAPLFLAGGLLTLLIVLVVALALGVGTAAQTGYGNLLALLPAAFLAGMLSFAAPCTLPLLPAYFAYTFQARGQNVALMTVAFFGGLATTLTLLGATATALSRLLQEYARQIAIVGGVIVIGFGLLSLLGKGFAGPQMQGRPAATLVGSYLYGATFALGWTACVGPILGALLTLLATQGIAIVQGAVLAFIYALGLGMPLILMATFFSRLGSGSRFWKIMRGRGVEVNLGFTTLYLHSTSIASGALLVVVGVLLASGQLTLLSQWSQSTRMGEWAVGLEQGIERLFFGR